MTIQLYIKPNTVGLCFENQNDRDTVLTELVKREIKCIEKFGQRSLRLLPDKATASFNIALDAEVLGVFMDRPVNAAPTQPAPPAPTEARVVPTAPAPIEPVAIIPAQPSMVAAAAIEQPTPAPQPPMAELPPATIEMPQVASVNAPQQPPKVDMRSRAGRALKAQAKA